MAISLEKPTINGDKDDWGTKLNANIDKQNIQDTTLESKLGFDYKGKETTTGSFSLFNNAIQVDLDTDIITFGHRVNTPTLTTPVLNGTITGTGVSSNGTDNALVKYGTNGLITCGSAGINTDIIINSGTLTIDGNIAGTIATKIPAVDKLVIYDTDGAINTDEIINTGTLTIDGEIVGTSSSTLPIINKLVKYDTDGLINSNNIKTNQIDLYDEGILVLNANTNVVGSLTVNGNAIESNIITEDLTITVGSGGDYTLLSSALNYLAGKTIGRTDSNEQVTVTISLLSGYVLDEAITIQNVDLSYVQITSVDSVVYVDYSAISGFENVFYFINSKTPEFNVESFELDEDVSNNIRFLRLENSETKFYNNTSIILTGFYIPFLLENSKITITTPTLKIFGTSSNRFNVGMGLSNSSIFSNCTNIYFEYGNVPISLRSSKFYSLSVPNIYLTNILNASGDACIKLYYSSNINIKLITVSGISAPYLLGCDHTSTASVEYTLNVNASVSDFFVDNGSIINIRGISGTATTNITANTLTSNGIIFSK